MKLKELITNEKPFDGYLDAEVYSIHTDSRGVRSGGILFLTRDGKDNWNYAQDGLNNGAICVVSDKKLDLPRNVVVQDVKAELRNALNRFYCNILDSFSFIGITGTNGKTTTAHVIYDVLRNSGIKVGVIGTLGAKWCEKKVELVNTTPSFVEFCRVLSLMKKDGVTHVVCEVSAHAISQDRLCGQKFDIGVFTNVSQDHLDYFGDMEGYRSAKLKFFEEYVSGYSIVNSDTEEGRLIARKMSNRTLTYGLQNPADVFGIDYEEFDCGQRFTLNLMDEIYIVESKLMGEFNRYNLLAGITVCRLLGVKGKKLVEGIKSINEVDGRFKVYKGDKTVIIDYAHTPDGMLNVLGEIKRFYRGKISCVFGCGGERDKTKRPLMGKIAEQLCDVVVLTEDNSRGEKTEDIIADIVGGMSVQPIIIEDRRDAIEFAIKNAKNDEIVVILGKGAEKYLEKCGKREYFSDEEEVEKSIYSVT
ncbi:MAG: UDP-N-acetylmuramoyl-L-alanyl-D-glutamate--2,6-diaminopimelate ligase [Clostridia bacterium]|nr:UDP-N-acetylmuramoyl-L-alanyl-D-glutamate--2,6-diaminopimelate ligase [Clostridia bacterium]